MNKQTSLKDKQVISQNHPDYIFTKLVKEKTTTKFLIHSKEVGKIIKKKKRRMIYKSLFHTNLNVKKDGQVKTTTMKKSVKVTQLT